MNYLLSFANASLGGCIRNPRRRLQRQAAAMGIFGDRIRIWTEEDLDADFRERMKKHVNYEFKTKKHGCYYHSAEYFFSFSL